MLDGAGELEDVGLESFGGVLVTVLDAEGLGLEGVLD